MANYLYDAYLTYAPEDGEFVDQLNRALRASGLAISSDRDLKPQYGEDEDAALLRAMAASRYVIVAMSPHYFSKVLYHELHEWQASIAREQTEGRTIVLPVLLKETVPPADFVTRKSPIDFRLWRDAAGFRDCLAELLKSIQFEDLAQSCMANECVLFAGAGLSARTGVPTWFQFLSDLLAHGVENKIIDPGSAQSLTGALKEGERNVAADGIVQMYGNRRDLLQSFLAGYFKSAGPLSTAHKYLQRINFSSIITTNYDRLLEETFPDYASDGLFTPRDSEKLLDSLSQRRWFILKLYGLIERLDTLIFAPIEYREALSSNVPFSKFMEGIFFSRSFFFVGLSLEGIQDFLSGFVFRGTASRKHYALVAVAGSAWKAKADFLRNRYQIEVIPFPVSEGFPEVETFLRDLSHAVNPESSTGQSAPAVSTPTLPGLRSVLLEEIGPFERLELDFPVHSDPEADNGQPSRWKILLGDNGVGKSTILKAIAVAIMGSDARSYAGRLVRTGKSRGRITLRTEHNPSGYVTEILKKDVLSEADIISLPTRPMEAEGWLALGFSPLRVVSWAPSTGPQGIVQKGRPTADDLLPLISGDSDPRMDRLKQWIVNLDSVDKPGRALSLTGHTGRVSSIAFTPDGRTLISGSVDKTIRFWDSFTGGQTRKIEAHEAGVNAIAVSRDGKLVASGSFDNSAKIWSIDSGDHVKSFRNSKSQILSVCFDREASVLLTGSESGSIRVYVLSSGTEVKRHSGDRGPWCMAVSPDGEVLATGTYAQNIGLINAQPEVIRKIQIGRGAITALVWSPDGTKLICTSKNGPAIIVNVSTGNLIKELPGSDTMSVAISPDGRLIAVGFDSGQIKVWDWEKDLEIMSVQGHQLAVWSLAFSPDGRTLASASDDWTIKLWTVPGVIATGNQQETIRRFFNLVGTLTDRQDIDYLRVTDDYRVMVKVADVTDGIPLELLSQGLTSLLGWIGVLCQRLKETLQSASSDPLPTNSYALVLIDELDAHMHPRWQQVLVGRLKKVFPNVQFIACTHSPLITAGLDENEVDRFALRQNKVVKVDFDSDMTLGRTDQILTGELFGLKDTLDMTTQKLLEEYEGLMAKDVLDSGQSKRFQELSEILNGRIPPSPTALVVRRAQELMDSLNKAHADLKLNKDVLARVASLSKALQEGI